MSNKSPFSTRQLTFGLILTIFLVARTLGLSAQKVDVSFEDFQTQLEFSEKHLSTNKNDSALIISQSVIDKLRANSELNSEIGIRFRLVEALALEKKEYDDLALERLTGIIGESLKMELWDVYARACLSEALIYEKSEQENECFEWLEKAEGVIKKHKLEKIYPYYAIRMASATRIFYSDEKAKYYINEAIRSGKEQNLPAEEALGHTLMLFVLPEDSISQGTYHWTQALNIYKELKDYTGISFCYGSITKREYKLGNYKEALAYNDSALHYTDLSIRNGFIKHPGVGLFNVKKGEILAKLGQKDTAIAYLEKGYKFEIDRLTKRLSTDVFEIVARIKLEKAEEAVDFQEARLQFQNTLLIIAILSLVIIAVVLYFLREKNLFLIESKKKLQSQNELILEQSSQLKSLDTAKTRFFANVSHELRTPLTLMLGPINTVLKSEDLDRRTEKLLKIASISGKDLMQLINEILALGKLDSGKMKLELKNTALKRFFQNCFVQFESMFHQKKISFSVLNSIEEVVYGKIDQTKCRQVVNNLISNAIKHTPENGEISIALKLENAQLFFLVSNSGEGIKSHDLPYIFERYYQGETTKFGGTGIGLALCKEYVDLFEGNISVYTSEIHHTVFEVRFPVETFIGKELKGELTPLVTNVPEAPKPMERLTRPGKATILLVEDNLLLQEYISMTLEQDYNVIIASNGQEALLKLASMTTCNLILSDLMMPVMDGYELIEKVKSTELTRDIPMVMLTARANLEDKLKALRIGVDDYITKPFNKEELLVRIGNLLKNKRVREEVVLKEEPHSLIGNKAEKEWLNAFEHYIKENCGNANLNIPEIAETFAMSESTLLRQLKKETGLTTIQFIQEVRLRKALILLEKGYPVSIKELAFEVGYKDARAFSRSFKKHFGKSPTDISQVL